MDLFIFDYQDIFHNCKNELTNIENVDYEPTDHECAILERLYNIHKEIYPAAKPLVTKKRHVRASTPCNIQMKPRALLSSHGMHLPAVHLCIILYIFFEVKFINDYQLATSNLRNNILIPWHTDIKHVLLISLTCILYFYITSMN